MAKYEIAVDEENGAEEFWDAVREHGGGSFSEPINALLRDDRVTVTADERDQLLAHFRRLPGWGGGPAHAQHPITVREVEST
jgi:hypothetical protein